MYCEALCASGDQTALQGSLKDEAQPIAVVVLEEGMVFFMHMILMDSETGRAMNLGESFVFENGTGHRLSRSSRDLFVG